MRLLPVLALSACASIQSVETTTDTALPPSIDKHVVADSIDYTATPSIHGHQLRIEIEQQETCTTTRTARFHRQRYVARTANPTVSRSIWALAATAIGTGAYSLGNADGLAAREDGPIAGATPTEYRQYGGGLLVLGVIATTIGIIDGVRATDSEYDDGVMDGDASKTDGVCHHQRTRNRDIALLLPNDQTLHQRTDEDGVVDFDLIDVPENGQPSPDIQLAIGDQRTRTKLTTTQLDELRASLLANPASRLARDVLRKRQDNCNAAVATARTQVPPEPADVSPTAHSAWTTAKSECTDLWSQALELELVAVDERVLYTECRSRLRAAASAFVDDSGTTVEEMTDELATLGRLCIAPEHVAQRKTLEAKLAATIKRIERVAAQTRRREEAAAAAERRRARAQRSFAEPDDDTSWSTGETPRACCRQCSTGKACGDSCIARWKTCHKGPGCACD